MATKAPVWGIDVGQCSLKAIKLQQVGEEVEALAFDVVEHPSILSKSEVDATELVLAALKTFASRNELSGCPVVIAVPGQQTLTRFTKMPPVEAKKIPDMVQYEASQQIPFDMDEVVWDYQVFTEPDSPDVEVGIFAIRKELIRNYLMQFTQAGIEPTIVQTSPMASYNAARYELSQEAGQAFILLDMGALATDLIVMEGKRIWSRPVPIGGNRFTDALVTAFKIPFAKAEKLKRNAATSRYRQQVFHAMRPVFADLVSEIQRSIGFYTSTHREAEIARVLGMGNAFRLPGLQKFLQQNLQIKLDLLGSFKKLKVSPIATHEEAFKENVMSYAVAYGLALQGLGLAAVSSNLVPREVSKSLLWRKKRTWFGAAAACLALSAASVWGSNWQAGRKLTEAKGGSGQVRAQPVKDAEAAMQVINGGRGARSELEWASAVQGAAEKLKSALQQEESKKSADEGTLTTMAKLPLNNVFVPQILSVVNESVASVNSPELVRADTPEAYLALAKRIPREQRKEIGIDAIAMEYDSKDPIGLFVSAEGDTKVAAGGAGWGVVITGWTSVANPEQWLDDTLMTTLRKLGRKPNQGYWFDVVQLKKVGPRPATAEAAETPTLGAPQTPAGGGGTRGGAGVGTRGGGARGRDDRGGGGLGFSSGTQSGGGASAGGRTGTAPGGGPSNSPGLGEALRELREKFRKQDPLTGESLAQDQMFELNIVVRKAHTPADKIPEEYKEAPPAAAGAAAPGAAKPGEAKPGEAGATKPGGSPPADTTRR